MLKKINIPIVMLAADTAMGDDYDPVRNIYQVGPMYFRHWFICFFEECYEEYKQYCSSGSIKKEKTLKRIEIMESSLIEYFELEDTDTAEQDASLSETTSSSEEHAHSDDSAPLTDTDPVGKDPSTENETEDSDLQEGSDHASVAEETDSYTASEQAEIIRETKPPEEAGQETA